MDKTLVDLGVQGLKFLPVCLVSGAKEERGGRWYLDVAAFRGGGAEVGGGGVANLGVEAAGGRR